MTTIDDDVEIWESWDLTRLKLDIFRDLRTSRRHESKVIDRNRKVVLVRYMFEKEGE